MKLLIGYDGSSAADAALRDLEMAGLPAEAEARVVVAIPPSAPAEAFAVDPTGTGWLAGAYVSVEPSPEQIEQAKDRGEHAAYLLEAKFPRWRVSVETALGTPAQAILDKAEAWKAGLIVMGSHGWSWLGRTFLGSTAEKVLTHAHVGVRLCNPRPETHAIAPRILAAVDGSLDSRHALDAIARRAWPTGVRIRLIAAKPSDPWSEALEAAEFGKAVGKATKGSWAGMEKLLDTAVARLAKAGLAAEWEIQEGDARAVILAEAEAFHADCIFLGRRGLSGFNRILLGSVSAAVASHAPCSVEVVPC
ncbi:MAG: universal stress protein [Fibrobacteres bacterium]|jgi:nucleotide-binding universal stress UspA family protein|nr:universal stress protein [Fibrobacterota bacterium]